MSELLLAKSADINASDGNGRPALHQVTLDATRRRYPMAAALTAATQRAHNGRIIRTTDSESEYRCMLVPPFYRACTVLYQPCTVLVPPLCRACTVLVLCCTVLHRVVPPLYHPCTVLIPCSLRR